MHTDPFNDPTLPFGQKTAGHVRDEQWLARHLRRRALINHALDLVYLALIALCAIAAPLALLGYALEIDVIRIFWGIQ